MNAYKVENFMVENDKESLSWKLSLIGIITHLIMSFINESPDLNGEIQLI